MREVVVRQYCDACWQESEAKVPATQAFTVGAVAGESRPALKLLELCDSHQKLITDLQLLLANVAGVTPAQLKAPAAAPAVAPSASMADCPACGQPVVKSSLVGHIWRMHRADPKPPLPTVCPECRERIDTGAGMATHRRVAHGYDAVADALSGVSAKDWPLLKSVS